MRLIGDEIHDLVLLLQLQIAVICHINVPLLLYYCRQGQVFIRHEPFFTIFFFCVLWPRNAKNRAAPAYALNRPIAVPASVNLSNSYINTACPHVEFFSVLVTSHLHLFLPGHLCVQQISKGCDMVSLRGCVSLHLPKEEIFAEYACSCATVSAIIKSRGKR